MTEEQEWELAHEIAAQAPPLTASQRAEVLAVIREWRSKRDQQADAA